MLALSTTTPQNNPDDQQRDAANRAEMRHFQQRGRHRMRTRRNDLGCLLWFRTLKWNPDGRKNQVPSYVIDLLVRLVRFFAVADSAEAPRLRSPEKFIGEWRRLPREELAVLCPDFRYGLTRSQMTRFLRLMEDWGIITRYRRPDGGDHYTLLIIRFNAARLLEILDVEIPRARRERCRKTPPAQAQPMLEVDQAVVEGQPSSVAITFLPSIEPGKLTAHPAIAASLEPQGMSDSVIQQTFNQST